MTDQKADELIDAINNLAAAIRESSQYDIVFTDDFSEMH